MMFITYKEILVEERTNKSFDKYNLGIIIIIVVQAPHNRVGTLNNSMLRA